MARPLREQFVLATIILLVPVGVVMTFAASTAHFGQVQQVRREAQDAAQIIAAVIDTTNPPDVQSIEPFVKSMPLPVGSSVIITDSTDPNRTLLSVNFTRNPLGTPPVYRPWPSRTRPWTVKVGIPEAVAWERAGPNYRRTIEISGLATAILLIMQVFFLRRWLPALASLERAVAQVGAGDFRVPRSAKMPSRELEHLRDAFRDMVDKIRAANEEIDRQMEEERRMRIEVESLQQQVIRQERLAAIGVLVSGIAHELNNPLQTISGFSELLQHDERMDDRTRSDLALIHQESARASAIIRNLSRFGRQQGSTPAAVDLSDVLSSVIELRQRRLVEQEIVLLREERATRPAHAVFTELQQVVLNFVINAEQSLRGNANARIILRTYDEGDRVHLEVEDSGPGVSAENETKLFQPFFTTKPVGEGTGLGLSVSYGIIHSLGGEIGYRRGGLGGALFYFSVPVSAGAPAKVGS